MPAMFIMMGIPGCGKTPWAEDDKRVTHIVSADSFRYDDVGNFHFLPEREDEVWAKVKFKARKLCEEGKTFAVDCANLTPNARSWAIKLGQEFDYTIIGIFFDANFEDCLERNNKRKPDRVVPHAEMVKMKTKLTDPTYEEGFHFIEYVKGDLWYD